MDRSQKESLIVELQNSLKTAKTVIVAHQDGLTVAESTELRDKMRESDSAYKIVKNRLAVRALKGTKFEVLSKLFLGPTAIAFSEDMVAPAKVAHAFSKENPTSSRDNFEPRLLLPTCGSCYEASSVPRLIFLGLLC